MNNKIIVRIAEGIGNQLITILHSNGNFNAGERGAGQTWGNGKQDFILGQVHHIFYSTATDMLS